MEEQESVYVAIAEMIRERSAAGQLVESEEISVELARLGLFNPEADEQKSLLHTTIGRVLEDNEDLNEISAANGLPCYYSSQSLSQPYAAILVRKKQGPLQLVAQVVRENSSIYPRPVPLDIFTEAPFDLTREEILDCLENMAWQQEYQDIGQTTTSIGTVFLYSSQSLDHAYASELAEWLDVGQANNP